MDSTVAISIPHTNPAIPPNTSVRQKTSRLAVPLSLTTSRQKSRLEWDCCIPSSGRWTRLPTRMRWLFSATGHFASRAW